MSSPKFSIIIPVFNREFLLCRSLDSVVAQNYLDWECIVIDDGSTPPIELNKKYQQDGRIRLYRLGQNQGVSAARNYGVKMSNFDWVCFLDSDDQWIGDKLSYQAHFVENNPHLRWQHANEVWLNNDKIISQKEKHHRGKGNQFSRSLDHCVIGASTVCISRDFFEGLGGFDQDLLICEDYELWLRACAREDIGLVPEVLSVKCAGEWPQLSDYTPGIDRWRLLALAKIFSKLSSEQQSLVKISFNNRWEKFLSGSVKSLDNSLVQWLINMLPPNLEELYPEGLKNLLEKKEAELALKTVSSKVLPRDS